MSNPGNSKPARPEVAVIVVNWNTRGHLHDCLASVQAQNFPGGLQAIVVDNASTDGSASEAAEFPGVCWIQNSRNAGFAAAVNQARAQTDAAYVLLLNPDARLMPGALGVLVDALRARPEIWAVGPRLVNSDGSLQPSGRRFPTLARTWWSGVLPEAVKRTRWWLRRVYGREDFQRPARVDEVSGACFAATREAWQRVGPFDERFFLYFEELDWFRRLAAAGGQVWYQPDSVVQHRGGAGMEQTHGEHERIHAFSAFRYWRKHGGRLAEAGARLILLLHSLVWMAARTLLTLLGLRPWRAYGVQMRRYARILRTSLQTEPA